MTDANKKYHSFAPSFYDKYIQDEENMQAKIKPILNQIQENRGNVYNGFFLSGFKCRINRNSQVTVKELHIQFGVRFSEILNSYRNRLEDLKDHYEKQISELQLRQNDILNKCNEVLDDLKKT